MVNSTDKTVDSGMQNLIVGLKVQITKYYFSSSHVGIYVLMKSYLVNMWNIDINWNQVKGHKVNWKALRLYVYSGPCD